MHKKIEKCPLEFKKVREVFFDLGKSNLSETAQANLDVVEQVLRQSKQRGQQVQIYVKGNASL